MKPKVDRARLKEDANMMLASFDEMHEYLKETRDREGSRILGSMMLCIGQFVDDLFELQREALALRDETKTKVETDKKGLKKDLRADFEEMVTHLIDTEDQEGFETLVRIKKGTNALIEGLIRREEDVFERWEID